MLRHGDFALLAMLHSLTNGEAIGVPKKLRSIEGPAPWQAAEIL